MSNNIIAIVGRPNVGKSTLFNRLTSARTAIEEKYPGITRDRLYGLLEWAGRELVIIDTGGLTFGIDDQLSMLVRHQVNLAIEEAQVIIFLLDGREGLTALDKDIANMLRKSGKSIIPVVNKVDYIEAENSKFDFFALGMADPLTVSASHGKGIGDLLDNISKLLPDYGDQEDDCQGDEIKVAVIGRPNVGKSSLVNALLGQERVIVSDQPGTTREAVDTRIVYQEQPYLFIDTAGIRRKSKVKNAVEYYSVLRSLKAVQRSDLVLLLIDGIQGISEQDQRLAGYADQCGRGMIIVVNKWDEARKTEDARKDFDHKIKDLLSFASYAPVIYLSALTGLNLLKLYPLLNQVWQEQHKRIQTALINKFLEDALSVHPPPSVKGRQSKIYFVTQPTVKPPTFVFFVNEPNQFHFSYKRYLENRIREAFGYQGTPVILKFKKRQQKGD